MADEKNTQFNYLLNAFERASQAERPADHGYRDKRVALIAHVRELERDAARYRWLRDKSDGAPDDTPTIYSARKDGRILYGAGLDLAVDLASGVAPSQAPLAQGFDGSAVRPGPNHSTIEIWYDTENQARAAHKVFRYLIDAFGVVPTDGIARWLRERRDYALQQAKESSGPIRATWLSDVDCFDRALRDFAAGVMASDGSQPE